MIEMLGWRCWRRSTVAVHEAATAALTDAQRWVTFTVAERTHV